MASASEQFRTCRTVDKAHFQPAIEHKSDRQAPAAQTANKWLRSIDRIDYPNPLTGRELRPPGFFTEKSVLWETSVDSIANKQLRVEIRSLAISCWPLLCTTTGSNRRQ